MNRTARRSADVAGVLAGLALLGVLGLFAALVAGAFRTDRTTELTRTITVPRGSTKRATAYFAYRFELEREEAAANELSRVSTLALAA